MKVNLADPSVYAYAPRRFAYSERLQIREIVDNLLARDIIQPSVSPYCARIVPFGYCESPAEFQKRLIQILNPLLRQDKVIIYIDDILIPTETVRQNLETIEQVLTIRPGTRMAHADALSRSVAYLSAMPLERELEYRQLSDPN